MLCCKMTKILSDKYPLLLILHLARLSCSCDLVTCVRTHRRLHYLTWKLQYIDLCQTGMANSDLNWSLHYPSQGFNRVLQDLIMRHSRKCAL